MIELLKNRSADLPLSEHKNVPISFDDRDYIDFLTGHNGGYYFQHSLHLFGLQTIDDFNDVEKVNGFVSREFKDLLKEDLRCFSQDIFGNLFAFNSSGQVVFLNIETGEFGHDSVWLQRLDSDSFE